MCGCVAFNWCVCLRDYWRAKREKYIARDREAILNMPSAKELNIGILVMLCYLMDGGR